MTEVKPFKVEEKVYLKTNNICTKQRSKKLNNKSIKPFQIKRNIKKSKLAGSEEVSSFIISLLSLSSFAATH